MAFRKWKQNYIIKPEGEASVSSELYKNAVSVWVLNQRFNKAVDYKHVNDLAFGATTAKPNWKARSGGDGLFFDGADYCTGTMATAITGYPIWMACSGTWDSTTFGDLMALTQNTAANNQSLDIRNGATFVEVFIRGSGASALIPSSVPFKVGKSYNIAVISRSRTSHAFFVNGTVTTSTADTGAIADLTLLGIGQYNRPTPTTFLTGLVNWAAYGTTDPGNNFLQRLSADPYPYLFPTPAFLRIRSQVSGGGSTSSSVSSSPSSSVSPSTSVSSSSSSSPSTSVSSSPSSSVSPSTSVSSSSSSSPSSSASSSVSSSVSPSTSVSSSSSSSPSSSVSSSPSSSSSSSVSSSPSSSVSPSTSVSSSSSSSPSTSVSSSPSSSVSPSTSVSSSSSSSPSTSVSSSSSSSVSSSSSSSPSSSVSPSTSVSSSPSSSVSSSPSTSASSSVSSSSSTSPSSSISTSPSASPADADYSRFHYVSLPLDDADLTTLYSPQEVIDVSTDDGVYVDQTGTSQYMLHQFKNDVGTNTSCILTWNGKTTLDTTVSTTYLQIYNQNTTTWESIDSDSVTPSDTDFTLTATMLSLTDYKDVSDVITCRVYQLAI